MDFDFADLRVAMKKLDNYLSYYLYWVKRYDLLLNKSQWRHCATGIKSCPTSMAWQKGSGQVFSAASLMKIECAHAQGKSEKVCLISTFLI